MEDNTSQAALTVEAAPWVLSLYNTPGVKVSYCAGYYLLGGPCVLGGTLTTGATPYYGQYFKRTYVPPVAHNQINLQMRVYTMDSWDGSTADDHFEIGIDGVNIYAWRIYGFNGIYANTDICGDPTYKDFPPFTVYMSYPHTSTTSLELKIISCADESSCNESIGFRDVKIEFGTNPAPSFSLCAIGGAPFAASPCPCPNPNMYMYPPNSGTCLYCYSLCATCTGAASTDCTSCYTGYYLYSGQCLPCNSNCATCLVTNPNICASCYTGKYLSAGQCLACDGNCATCVGTSTTCTSCNAGWFLVGSACYSTCNSPLTSYVSNGVTYCQTPCPGQFVYWDSSCGSTCSYASNAAGTFGIYPTNINTFSICNYPCSSPTQVLYWNGTCSSTSCLSPLSMTIFHGSSFCDYQCGSNQYLYWNGTCSNNCPSPLSDETQGTNLPRNFCWFTCQPNEYLYWNGTCSSNCPSPLSSEIQGTNPLRKFCWYTCQPNDFLYWNGSCLSTCPSPLSSETQGTSLQRQFCWSPCQPSEYLYWNGSCLSTCPSPLTPEIQGTNLPQKFCWYTCQPNEYLYWDGVCRSSCDFPLWPETQGTSLQRQFCWFPCKPTESLYWNGTCQTKCNYPLSSKIFAGRHFCNYLCEPNHYLWQNGSCLPTCPIGFWKNDEYRFCAACLDPLCAVCDLSFGTSCEVCKEQSILNSNSICQDCQALSSEYIKQNDETYEYQYKLRLWPPACDLDETAFKKYLSPTQKSKALFPDFGFQILKTSHDSTGKYFLIKLNFTSPILEENKLNFTLSYLSTAPKVPKTPEKAPTSPTSLKTIIRIINTGTLLSGLYLGSTAGFWSLICLQQFIGYFAYTNIIYPHHLNTFLIIFVSTNLEFLPNPLESLMNRLSDEYDSVVDQKEQQELYQLPYKFEALETPTLFIINAGCTFFLCLIFFLIPYILGQLRKLEKLKGLKFLQNLHSGFKWNAVIRIFLESGIPIAFAIFIQIRKVSYNNIPFALSTFCATIALIYLCWMLHYVYHTLIKIKFEEMKNPNIEKSVGTLYEGLVLNKDKPSQKYYYVIVLARGMLLVGVNVFIDEIPLLQIIVMALFNIFFAYYVCKKIEFESRYLTLANQIGEVFILIGEILIATLCPRSLTGEFEKLIGWLIIVLFSSVLIAQFAYGIYLQILALKDLVKKARDLLEKRRQRRKVAPVIEVNFTVETSENRIMTENPPGNVTFRENFERIITIEN